MRLRGGVFRDRKDGSGNAGPKRIMTDSILIIAGSDSCAGAGIQIDLKTAAAHGVYATCALTAVTAQNTTNVEAVQVVDPQVAEAQIEAVFADIPPRAVKIGMLGSSDVALAVARVLGRHPEVPVVLDPVLVATAGGALTEAAAFDAIRGTLMKQAALITPNLPEAAALSGVATDDAAGRDAAAQAFLSAGVKAVLLKGGHAEGDIIEDRLYTPEGVECFTATRLAGEYHGTGCSLSTAIACNLAKGASLSQAVAQAHAYLADALRHIVDAGRGTKIFNPLNRLDTFYGV